MKTALKQDGRPSAPDRAGDHVRATRLINRLLQSHDRGRRGKRWAKRRGQAKPKTAPVGPKDKR